MGLLQQNPPQKIRKTANKKLNFRPKATRKRRTNKPNVSKRKDIIKIKAEINKDEENNSKDQLN